MAVMAVMPVPVAVAVLDTPLFLPPAPVVAFALNPALPFLFFCFTTTPTAVVAPASCLGVPRAGAALELGDAPAAGAASGLERPNPAADPVPVGEAGLLLSKWTHKLDFP